MTVHPNAKTTPKGRALIMQRLNGDGWTAARAFGVSRHTVLKWRARHRARGLARLDHHAGEAFQQRLVDMHPDVAIMFSGNNDVHWARDGRDLRWFYGPLDQNYMLLLNELYKSSGHPEWTFTLPSTSRPFQCSELASIASHNVDEAATSLDRVNARLIFALQPNVVSTAKHLSQREQQLPEVQNKAFWDSCYQALRDGLSRTNAKNYRFLDLSQSFGEFDEHTELFVDSYHFADRGNRRIAEALADQIDWRSIVPGAAVVPDSEPLKIVSLSPTEASGQFDGVLHASANRVNRNLVVIFDRSVLPTVVANGTITASIPASLHTAKGEHKIYVADSMTGETSPPRSKTITGGSAAAGGSSPR